MFTVSFTVTVSVGVSSLSLADTLQPAVPFIDGAVDEPLREFASFSDDHMLELID